MQRLYGMGRHISGKRGANLEQFNASSLVNLASSKRTAKKEESGIRVDAGKHSGRDSAIGGQWGRGETTTSAQTSGPACGRWLSDRNDDFSQRHRSRRSQLLSLHRTGRDSTAPRVSLARGRSSRKGRPSVQCRRNFGARQIIDSTRTKLVQCRFADSESVCICSRSFSIRARSPNVARERTSGLPLRSPKGFASSSIGAAAGLDQSVSFNYMQRQRAELNWVRLAISSVSNPYYRWRERFERLSLKRRVDFLRAIKNEWVEKQRHYFVKTACEYFASLHFWHVFGYSLALAGTALVAAHALYAKPPELVNRGGPTEFFLTCARRGRCRTLFRALVYRGCQDQAIR